MTFAAPLFLLAALAAAVPVVLHLVDRRRAKDAPFPTLRFLKLSVQKTRRRKRVQDLLLMTLRAAILALLAVGLARPAITSLGALWGGAQTAAVVILDNSASMGTIDRSRVRLETAAAAATQILDQLGDGDQAAVLPACGPPLPEAGKLDRTQQSARQILRQCRVSYERAALALKLRQARQLLDSADAPNKQIFILSDMQRASWGEDGGRGTGSGMRKGEDGNLSSPFGRGAGGEGGGHHAQSALTLTLSQRERGPLSSHRPQSPDPSPVPVIVVDCDRAPKPNAAIVGIELDAAAPMTGMPMKAVVVVSNAAAVAQQRLVELTIDGVKQSSSAQLNLPPGGRVKSDLTFSLSGAGLHRGEARLAGEDGSQYDDHRFFAVAAGRSVPVAIVKPRRHEIAYLDDAFYLEQALASGSGGEGGFDVSTLLPGDLAGEPLEKYRVVFCVNLPAPEGQAAERLANYVAGGGNLVWICGDNVEPEAYNRMDLSAGGRLLPAPMADVRAIGPQSGRDSWRVGFIDKDHPALGGLNEPASLYESVLLYRHVRMAVEKGQARVLARLDDGEPLLAERAVGDGRTLLLGAAVTTGWTNLPLRPIFLPLVVRLALHLAQSERIRTDVLAGQPLEYKFPDGSAPDEVKVVRPGGETLRFAIKPRPPVAPADAGDNPAATADATAGRGFVYEDTYDIGIYELRIRDAGNHWQIAYAVNFDPAEADPARIEAAELEEMLGGAPLIVAADADDLAATFVRLREGKSLWGPFLAAVLVALVFETFLANRFGAKG